MRFLAILIALAVSLTLVGCSQEESAAPEQSTAPAPAPAEQAKVVDQAKQVAEQTGEKVAQVAEQAGEKVAQAGEQVAAVVQQAEGAAASGQAVYSKACVSCHKLGIAGAPKTGDKAAWTPLIASGIDKLAENAINGKGKMPAKGGNAKLTDDEVKAAVEYMVEQSQ